MIINKLTVSLISYDMDTVRHSGDVTDGGRGHEVGPITADLCTHTDCTGSKVKQAVKRSDPSRHGNGPA